MAEGGGKKIFQINTNNVQEGDERDVRVEKKTETNIINSAIEQVNIQQAEASNEAAEDLVEGALGMSSQSSNSKSASNKASLSGDQERPEDFFQKHVIRQFADMAEFKKFARSRVGLCLDHIDVQTIVDNNPNSVDDQRMNMLFKWKEKMGKDATVPKMRSLLEGYKKSRFAGDSKDVPGKMEERDEINEIKQTFERMDLSPQDPAQTRVRKMHYTSSDQGVSNECGPADEKQNGIERVRNSKKIISKDTSSPETENKAIAFDAESKFDEAEDGKPSTSKDQDKTKSKESSSGAKGNEKSISIRCELLKGRAFALYAQSKFHKASSYLEQLTSIRGEKDLTTVLLQAECNLQLGREKNADKNIDDVRTLLMTSPSHVDDVINFACDLIDDKSYVRAVVLLRIASEIYKLDTSLSPDDVVKRIYKCVSKMDDATKPMIESGGRLKIIARDYSLVFMVKMFEFLRAVENADPAIKAEREAWCVNSIGFNYFSADEYEKSIEFRKTGVDIMERQFGKNASKYKIYGHMLHNIGISSSNLGRYDIAVEYHMKSIAAKINASDFSSEDEKKKSIERSEIQLRNTLEKKK